MHDEHFQHGIIAHKNIGWRGNVNFKAGETRVRIALSARTCNQQLQTHWLRDGSKEVLPVVCPTLGPNCIPGTHLACSGFGLHTSWPRHSS